jgi:hypothetical protein
MTFLKDVGKGFTDTTHWIGKAADTGYKGTKTVGKSLLGDASNLSKGAENLTEGFSNLFSPTTLIIVGVIVLVIVVKPKFK